MIIKNSAEQRCGGRVRERERERDRDRETAGEREREREREAPHTGVLTPGASLALI